MLNHYLLNFNNSSIYIMTNPMLIMKKNFSNCNARPLLIGTVAGFYYDYGYSCGYAKFNW